MHVGFSQFLFSFWKLDSILLLTEYTHQSIKAIISNFEISVQDKSSKVNLEKRKGQINIITFKITSKSRVKGFFFMLSSAKQPIWDFLLVSLGRISFSFLKVKENFLTN